MKINFLKILNSCLLIFIFACESDNASLTENRNFERKHSERDLVLLLLAFDFGILHNCIEDYLVTELINENEKSFLEDSAKEYKSAIIGDSTMVASQSVPGFFNALETKSIALNGNTLCGMILQIGRQYISTLNHPDFILTSSMGGNDLIRGSDPVSVGNRGILYISTLIKLFPTARLTFVLVHPILIGDLNLSKNISNNMIISYVNRIKNSNVCLIDPMSEIFKIGPNDKPSIELMRDNVHYIPDISLQIRALAIKKCRMVF